MTIINFNNQSIFFLFCFAVSFIFFLLESAEEPTKPLFSLLYSPFLSSAGFTPKSCIHLKNKVFRRSIAQIQVK